MTAIVQHPSIDNPYLVPIQETSTPFTFCLECDRPDLTSRADCKRWLKALDLEHLPMLAPNRPDCPGAPHHHTVELVLNFTSGSRTESILQTTLQRIDPGIENPVQRYRAHRRQQHAEIFALLVNRYGDGMERVGGAKSGDAWRLGCRKGEAPVEPLGVTLARMARDSWQYWEADIQQQVNVESGIGVVVTQFLVRGHEILLKLERSAGRSTAESREAVRERMAWVLLDWYCNLFAHIPEVNSVRTGLRALKGAQLAQQAIRRLQLDPDFRVRLEGDLAVLQFQLHRTTPFFPKARKAEHLIGCLGDTGYPRLGQRERTDTREVIEGIICDIGAELERVVIAKVDWRPLLGNLHFKQKVRK